MKIISIILIALVLAMPAMAVRLDFDLAEQDKQVHFMLGAGIAEYVRDSGGNDFEAFMLAVMANWAWEWGKGKYGDSRDVSAGAVGAMVDLAIIRNVTAWIAERWNNNDSGGEVQNYYEYRESREGNDGN